MPLSAGDKLGYYEVLSLLGQGGMGEVYRAKDTKLDRDVAIKVLPQLLALDPERLARFEREAKVLASLDHPNIGQIHGIVESEESRGLVLALIEGPTLADRINAGPIPLDEAIAIAKQIIEALEYAHDRGVVHRDLKPANVKITFEGVVKVLDFGLAKVLEDEPPSSSLPNSPTLTMGHTRAGVILGTAAYMSPEQAVGGTADRRSDIFSFGAVLYEMATGKRAFAGETTPDVLEAVVKNDPDWLALPADTPGAVRELLRRCLVKNRKQRLQAIGEARIVLEQTVEQALSLEPDFRPARSWSWIATTAVTTTVAGVALWGWLQPAPPESRPVTRFTTTTGKSSFPLPVLSRDGSRLAQMGDGISGISLRLMDQFEPRSVPGTEGVGTPPCFSPDGEWIAFASRGGDQLKKAPVSGGAALTLAKGLDNASTCSWGEDDKIYFVADSGIQWVVSSGGKPETLVAPDAKKNESTYYFPQLLPGAKHLLFAIASTQGMLQAAIVNLQTKEKKLLQGEGLARYARSGPNPSVGHLVYGHNGSLFAASFDVNRLVLGAPSPLLDGVANFGPIAMFGISDSGTLAYIASGAQEQVPVATLVRADRQGAEQPIPAPPRDYGSAPKLSPDGNQLAVSIRDRETLTADIWIYDLVRGSLERLTSAGNNRNPVWTPDGKQLIYRSSMSIAGRRSGALSTVPADRSGAPTSLLAGDTLDYIPTSVSPDGMLLVTSGGRATQSIWALPLAAGASSQAKPSNFLESKFNQADAQFSPDGRWVAYASDDSGRTQIHVVPYPGPGRKYQISLDGGDNPRWNHNGQELFFRSGTKIMAVDVQTSPAFRAGTPKMLFETARGAEFDVTPDGRRFLIIKPAEAQPGRQNDLRIVLNWFEELRRRVPLPK
jgi:serine/threonine protein kinase/Tol biopolymer transport system component